MSNTSCTTPVQAFIALGSNLGDRAAHIQQAIIELDHTQGLNVGAVSALFETDPVGPAGQGAYLNAAAEVYSTLGPRELLARMLEIERAHGREREQSERWGPRVLDLDLLLFGDRIINQPGLCVPHPHMHERQFVLGPLAAIAPQVVHPILQQSVKSLLIALAQSTPMEYGSALRG
jgi:2-amino-4-hydroxy-6-hydroxymethyldihydropteridine diphosphokinase